MNSLKYHDLSDQELVFLIRRSDQLAYRELYDRYKVLLYDHAYKKLGDYDEVKDILQEVFAVIWEARAKLPDTDNMAGYLYTAVRNRIFNLLKHRQVRSAHKISLQSVVSEGQYSTDHAFREKEFNQLIEQEINELPAKMREVFLLSRRKFLTHQQIADELRISETTVSKQITNALKILRKKLGIVIYIFLLLKW